MGRHPLLLLQSGGRSHASAATEAVDTKLGHFIIRSDILAALAKKKVSSHPLYTVLSHVVLVGFMGQEFINRVVLFWSDQVPRVPGLVLLAVEVLEPVESW